MGTAVTGAESESIDETFAAGRACIFKRLGSVARLQVKLGDLTVMEREVIHYYLSAIGQKLMIHRLQADEEAPYSHTT